MVAIRAWLGRVEKSARLVHKRVADAFAHVESLAGPALDEVGLVQSPMCHRTKMRRVRFAPSVLARFGGRGIQRRTRVPQREARLRSLQVRLRETDPKFDGERTVPATLGESQSGFGFADRAGMIAGRSSEFRCCAMRAERQLHMAGTLDKAA